MEQSQKKSKISVSESEMEPPQKKSKISTSPQEIQIPNSGPGQLTDATDATMDVEDKNEVVVEDEKGVVVEDEKEVVVEANSRTGQLTNATATDVIMVDQPGPGSGLYDAFMVEENEEVEEDEAVDQLSQEITMLHDVFRGNYFQRFYSNGVISSVGIQMTGPANSPFYGLGLDLSLSFSGGYPQRPPRVSFIYGDTIHHPNVDPRGDLLGGVLLARNWNSRYNLLDVLQSVDLLLAHPDYDNIQINQEGLTDNHGVVNFQWYAGNRHQIRAAYLEGRRRRLLLDSWQMEDH